MNHSYYKKLVSAAMHNLLSSGKEPTFSAFQCTDSWLKLRKIMSLNQQRVFILTWDRLYFELALKIEGSLNVEKLPDAVGINTLHH